MLSYNEIKNAGCYVETLRLCVDGIEMLGNSRTRAAGACFAVAQEHHHAIIYLIHSGLVSSAFALIRAEFEAYIRGEWLSQCASESVVEAFLKNKEPQRLDCLLSNLAIVKPFNRMTLFLIKEKTWKSLCAYMHTGGLQVQRWNTECGIEANYSREEVLEVIRFAEIIALLSVMGVAHLANNDALAIQILDSFRRRFPLLEDTAA